MESAVGADSLDLKRKRWRGGSAAAVGLYSSEFSASYSQGLNRGLLLNRNSLVPFRVLLWDPEVCAGTISVLIMTSLKPLFKAAVQDKKDGGRQKKNTDDWLTFCGCFKYFEYLRVIDTCFSFFFFFFYYF